MMPGTFQVPDHLLDAIGTHARAQHPRECCGFLTGSKNGVPDTFVPIPNVHRNPELFYEMDEPSILSAYRRMDETLRHVLAIYHSHTGPTTSSALSRTDVEQAIDLGPVQIVCCTARSTISPVFQAWRITEDREVVGVALDIVDDSHPESPLAGLVEGNRVRVTYDSTAGRRTVVAKVGRRSDSGAGVVLHRARGGPTVVALDRIRAVGLLAEGSSAVATRARAVECLEEAAVRLGAGDVSGARTRIADAGALLPRLIPQPAPVPRAWRPKRKGE